MFPKNKNNAWILLLPEEDYSILTNFCMFYPPKDQASFVVLLTIEVQSINVPSKGYCFMEYYHCAIQRMLFLYT